MAREKEPERPLIKQLIDARVGAPRIGERGHVERVVDHVAAIDRFEAFGGADLVRLQEAAEQANAGGVVAGGDVGAQ